MIPWIPMGFENIGSTLRSWVDGETNAYTDDIDLWMKDYI